MKVLQINTFGNFSTGKIAVDLYRGLKESGYEGIVAFARNSIPKDVPSIKIGSKWSVYADGVLTRLTDRAGFYSTHATKVLIQHIKDYDPDIIHLHNLHGYYLNIKLLFEYLRESGKPVIWTLHDCWAFTGHCCYYSMVGCDKWKRGCSKCPQKGTYPKSILIDNSEWNFRKKKELFTSLPNLHLVCVSKWLKGEVEQSFLKDLPCEVIYNGIDLNTFKPTKGDFRQRFGLEDKKIILGVASTWNVRKGLNDFIELAGLLDDQYRIVLVGLDEKQKVGLPSKIIGLSRTKTDRELVEIYSTADVFFNASVEETFGLPTIEAMACGTPVIVYDSTALPEIVLFKEEHVVRKNLQRHAEIVAKISSIIGSNYSVDQEELQKYSKEAMKYEYETLYREVLALHE